MYMVHNVIQHLLKMKWMLVICCAIITICKWATKLKTVAIRKTPSFRI